MYFFLVRGWDWYLIISQIRVSDMVKPEQTSTPCGCLPAPFHQGLPSPSLSFACGLCIMLAGINVTLVGVLAFGTGKISIIVGPLLLLVAAAFFVACCVAGRYRAHMAEGGKRGEKWGLMQMRTVAFEMETSEHTLQDTTAVQLSPTNSPSSSHKSTSSRGSGSPAWGGGGCVCVCVCAVKPVSHSMFFELK